MRLEQYRRAVELRKRGMTVKGISEEVGVGVRALYRWFAAGGFPERQPRRDKGPRLPTPVAKHLIRRWNEGCHNVQKLYKEIEEIGYGGSIVTVYYFARYLRKGLAPPGYATAPTKGAPEKSEEQHLSPRGGAFGLMLPVEKLDSKQRSWIEQIHEDQSPRAALAHALARRLVEMFRERRVEELEGWLVDAQNSGIEELKDFAEGIVCRNLSAVRAALTEEWSNAFAPYCALSTRSRAFPVFWPVSSILCAAGSRQAVRTSIRPCRCRGAPSRALCGTRPSPSLC